MSSEKVKIVFTKDHLLYKKDDKKEANKEMADYLIEIKVAKKA